MAAFPGIPRRFLAATLAVATLTPAATPAALPADLKKETLAAYQRYVILREEQLDAQLRRAAPCPESAGNGEECGGEDSLLWVDSLPERNRAAAHQQLSGGDVVIERLKVLDEQRREIDCPDGLIHHWMGTVFIPGATLDQVIALVQDYDRHHVNYAPEVLISRTLARQGDDFRIEMRFVKKKMITVVVDTWQDVRYVSVGPGRMHSRAIATRIQEVEHAGKPNERRKPEGKDGGYLWRLNTYWMFTERDGGVYVQCEAISLTRDVPRLLGWLKSFLTSVPRESLHFSLGATRDLLLRRQASTRPN